MRVCALLGTLAAFVGMVEARSGVEVNINLGPPPIVVAEPPEMVLIPGSEVYFVPQSDVDIFFYNGFWWCPRGHRWYRARAYNGPWGLVERRLVPVPVIRVPGDFRSRFEHERHIPYGEWKRRGERGERGERREWKEERQEHRGEGRGRGRGRD